jgi:diaminopimelate decarboxylase
MARSGGASAPQPEPKTAAWAERQAAAYRAAEQEIELLRPGEAILYHEGYLATEVENDPTVAGRAAAFRDASEAARGRIAQRRLGFEWYQYIFWRAHRER